MRRWQTVLMVVCAMAAGSGCINITLPSQISASLLPPDTSFVINGQAEAAVDSSTFPVWRGEDGQGFVLFQTLDVTNAHFDSVMTPGARARIQVQVRNDLAPLCQPDVVPVEVLKVLQINGKDVTR
jgi:hypothetical protein